MIPYTIAQIAKMTSGMVIGDGSVIVDSIVSDSRKACPGSLFVAFKGDKFDGHDYISQALAGGCKAVLISDERALRGSQANAVLVEDTVKGYGRIASAYRLDAGFKVIAVTGSVGKTSTREFIASALSKAFAVHKTKENLNNEIGLPMTLLETPHDCEICVVEMGMRALGEIRELTNIALPDIAAITNIGTAHIGLLGSREAILEAKTEIAEGLRDDGPLIINIDDPMLKEYRKNVHGKKILSVSTGTQADTEADIYVRGFEIRDNGAQIFFKAEIFKKNKDESITESFVIPVPGSHNVTNALFGIAAAVYLGADMGKVKEGFTEYLSLGGRQRISNVKGYTVIDDSYNAGPESMLAAIRMLSSYPAQGRRIAVLGGMLELGEYSEIAHVNVGRACSENGVDMLFTVKGPGEKYLLGAEGWCEVKIFNDTEELSKRMTETIKPGDVVLVKGSRSFKMENVVQRLSE